jgi:hypothetical protein
VVVEVVVLTQAVLVLVEFLGVGLLQHQVALLVQAVAQVALTLVVILATAA